MGGGGGDGGGGREDVAGLHRLEIAYGLAAACRLDDVDQAPEFLRVVVADVVECVRRLAAARLDRAIVGGRRVERGDHAGYDIVDIGEIEPHRAVVEQRDRLAAQDFRGEDPRRHGGPPPSAVDGYEA